MRVVLRFFHKGTEQMQLGQSEIEPYFRQTLRQVRNKNLKTVPPQTTHSVFTKEPLPRSQLESASPLENGSFRTLEISVRLQDTEVQLLPS